MATKGQNDSEDSGFMSVTSPQTPEKNTYYSTASEEANKETDELIAIKTKNRNLSEKIKTLRQKINEQMTDFNAEKMNLIRNHKRVNDHFKKIHEKTLARMSTKSLDILSLEDEIKRMKFTIESLRKIEKELRDKIEQSRKDSKYRTEYEKLKREMSASKEELRRLAKQIVVLEKKVAEKDKEISTATNRNVDLSSEIESLAKKDDMEAMENKLVDKMEAMEKNMIENMQKLFAQQMQSQKKETETRQQSEQNKLPLPPIAGPTPQNSMYKERPDWKPY
ncbi:M protein, serotype 2.1-like [Ruditapes philippinarum]|uniref:M protein, serotype 2.1-like n=1 Tax=Ruditapes philippinarum TaxID=129788 RepID=UPI00295B8095|nr:M protein, serotype 2.1-like [Ruditapes philippinarum]